VRWLGRLDDRALSSCVAGANVLCAPSLYGESFGVVLLEAMVAGTAVVASDLAGYRAVVGQQATLVPPGDVPAWSAALRAAVDDAAHGAGTSDPLTLQRAASHAQQWSMTAVAERYAAIYEEALGTGAG
jgi:phosphatidylinositol alpha-mannosyltransferase